MTNVDKLKEKEIAQLSADEELYDLETLITGGQDVRVPVEIMFPKYDKETGEVRMVRAGALLRPLTNIEWNNAASIKKSSYNTTTTEVELLKMALYTPKGNQMPPEIVEAIPNGVVVELVKEVSRISGIDLDANMKLIKEMGFSI